MNPDRAQVALLAATYPHVRDFLVDVIAGPDAGARTEEVMRGLARSSADARREAVVARLSRCVGPSAPYIAPAPDVPPGPPGDP